MTDPAIPSDDAAEKSTTDSTASDDSTAETSDSVPSGMSDAPLWTYQDADELPEEEELTPELVEEEAIRGDFMLRWAAVFLAVLCGFTLMADTETLVHIRSGEQMQENSFLPSGEDVFSYTVEGQSWSNTSWLFDHLAATAWKMGGPTGLSVLKAFLAAVFAFLLVRISVPGIPTWWGSICAAFAITCVVGRFGVTTYAITLLGMVIVMHYLQKWRHNPTGSFPWQLPVTIAVWANLDPRAFLGAFAVILFAAGTALANFLRAEDQETPGIPLKSIGLAALTCVAALLVNPFPMQSLFSVSTVLLDEYPTMQLHHPLTFSAAAAGEYVQYYGLLDDGAGMQLTYAHIAGMTIFGLAGFLMLMNRRPSDVAMGFVWAGFGILALWHLKELAAAAVVASVIAATSAQYWYARSFRQEYSVEPKEILFSRGGRAATVFAFALLGFCFVSGQLPVSGGVGLGFDADFATTMSSLEDQLKEHDPEQHIFNTNIRQGDFLIWCHQPSFIDTRVSLFGDRYDEDSIVARHDDVRFAMLLNMSEIDNDRIQQPDVWGQAFEEFDVSYVISRLDPPPDYQTLTSLNVSPDFALVSLEPSAALFVVRDRVDPGSQPELFDIVNRIFRPDDIKLEEVPSRGETARPQDFYEKWVYRPSSNVSGPLRIVRHYSNQVGLISTAVSQRIQQFEVLRQRLMEIAGSEIEADQQEAAALNAQLNQINNDLRASNGPLLAYLIAGIREANKALRENPRDTDAYRVLGVMYEQLNRIESQVAAPVGGQVPEDMRYRQSVYALRQAVTRDPEDAAAWEILHRIYSGQQRTDLALEALSAWLPLYEKTMADNPTQLDQLQQLAERRQQLEEAVSAFDERIDGALKEHPLPTDEQARPTAILGMVSMMDEEGFPLRALQTLRDEYGTAPMPFPELTVLRARLQMEAGELEDGINALAQLSAHSAQDVPRLAAAGWYYAAALSNLAIADYETAITLLEDNLKNTLTATATAEVAMPAMMSLPVSAASSMNSQMWPGGHCASLKLSMEDIPKRLAEARFRIAMMELEAGRNQRAGVLLRVVIETAGNTPYRALAAYYLQLLRPADAVEIVNSTIIDAWETGTLGEFGFRESEASAPEGADGETNAPGDSAGASDEEAKPAAEGTPAAETDTEADKAANGAEAAGVQEPDEPSATDDSDQATTPESLSPTP